MSTIQDDVRKLAEEERDRQMLARLADPSIPVRVRASPYVLKGEIMVAAIPEGLLTVPYTLVLCHSEDVLQVKEALGFRS